MRVLFECNMDEFLKAWNIGDKWNFVLDNRTVSRTPVLEKFVKAAACADCGIVPNRVRLELTPVTMTPTVNFYVVNDRFPTGQKFVSDFVIPLVWGGSHSLANVQFLCRNCMKRKSDHYAGTSKDRRSYAQVLAGDLPKGGSMKTVSRRFSRTV